MTTYTNTSRKKINISFTRSWCHTLDFVSSAEINWACHSPDFVVSADIYWACYSAFFVVSADIYWACYSAFFVASADIYWACYSAFFVVSAEIKWAHFWKQKLKTKLVLFSREEQPPWGLKWQRVERNWRRGSDAQKGCFTVEGTCQVHVACMERIVVALIRHTIGSVPWLLILTHLATQLTFHLRGVSAPTPHKWKSTNHCSVNFVDSDRIKWAHSSWISVAFVKI